MSVGDVMVPLDGQGRLEKGRGPRECVCVCNTHELLQKEQDVYSYFRGGLNTHTDSQKSIRISFLLLPFLLILRPVPFPRSTRKTATAAADLAV